MTYSVGNFFRYYVAHPQEAPKDEKVKAWFLTVLAGICTLTVLPLAVLAVSNIRWKNFDEFKFAQNQKIQNVAQPVIKAGGEFEDSLSSKLKAKLSELKLKIQAHEEFLADHPYSKTLKAKGVKEFDKSKLQGLQDRNSELIKLEKKVDQEKAKAPELIQAIAKADQALEAYTKEEMRYLGDYERAKVVLL